MQRCKIILLNNIFLNRSITCLFIYFDITVVKFKKCWTIFLKYPLRNTSKNERHLHFFYNAYSFHLYSDKFSYLHENESINIKEDSTITHPQQSTEQTHAENPSMNGKKIDILTVILLGTIIPICVLSVVCSCYVFHKRSKVVLIVLCILLFSHAVKLSNIFESINILHSSIKNNVVELQSR